MVGDGIGFEGDILQCSLTFVPLVLGSTPGFSLYNKNKLVKRNENMQGGSLCNTAKVVTHS